MSIYILMNIFVEMRFIRLTNGVSGWESSLAVCSVQEAGSLRIRDTKEAAPVQMPGSFWESLCEAPQHEAEGAGVHVYSEGGRKAPAPLENPSCKCTGWLSFFPNFCSTGVKVHCMALLTFRDDLLTQFAACIAVLSGNTPQTHAEVCFTNPLGASQSDKNNSRCSSSQKDFVRMD